MKRDNVVEWKMQKEVKRRLCGIAGAFERLSGSISSFASPWTGMEQAQLTKMFDEISMPICSECSQCGQCWGDKREQSLAEAERLLSAIQESGGMPGEDGGYLVDCKRRGELFEGLGRGLLLLRQGLVWRNRINESREAVADQLTEMARIVGEFAGNLEQQGGKVWEVPRSVYTRLWLKQIYAKRMLMLEKSDGSLELHMTARCRRGRCMTTKEAAMILSCIVGEHLVPGEASRHVIGKDYSDYVFREDANFEVMTGVARAVRADSRVSGDNFSFLYPEGGEVIMLLSDGMGSGEAACRESERVIELLEQFLEAGFKEEAAMRLINSMLVLRTENTMFSTMDITVWHLTTGMCDFMKAGAAATFILRGDWMESISSTTLPAGMLSCVSYDVKQKKLYEGDYVIMVSDGVAESDGEEFIARALSGSVGGNPQEIANVILEAAMKREDYQPKDDMTVLVAGLSKRTKEKGCHTGKLDVK